MNVSKVLSAVKNMFSKKKFKHVPMLMAHETGAIYKQIFVDEIN